MKRFIGFAFLFFLCAFAFAQTIEPLPEEVAFSFTAMAKDSETLIGVWDIKPGYYLYRDRIQFFAIKSDHDRLGAPLWPKTEKTKDFPGNGKVPVYFGHLEIPVPILTHANPTILVKVFYQGCSESGFCYPPVSRTVNVDLSGNYLKPVEPLSIDVPSSDLILKNTSHWLDRTQIERLVNNPNHIWLLLGFLGLGLLLSLTPCVLPMVPILLSIIAGQHKRTTARTFSLSLAYVLGMSLAYALMGLIFGYLGSTLQVTLQKPWIILLFSFVFIAMALWLFGFLQIRLPEHWQTKLTELSNRQKTGTYLGVAIMGGLSTLLLSPCVTAPLVVLFGYIGETGNAGLGAIGLFALGLGMGVPLLVIGATSAKWLPKPGYWMNIIKYLLGILMLIVAFWMIARILPVKSSFIEPSNSIQIGTLTFARVTTIDEVKQELNRAQKLHQPTFVDFYASWCISCNVIDNSILKDPSVQNILTKFHRVRADISQNTAQNQLLLQHYKVLAPPTLLFFDTNGQEVHDARLVGETSKEQLIQALNKALPP